LKKRTKKLLDAGAWVVTATAPSAPPFVLVGMIEFPKVAVFNRKLERRATVLATNHAVLGEFDTVLPILYQYVPCFCTTKSRGDNGRSGSNGRH